MLSILTAFTIGLVIGAFAGAWANTAYQVRQSKTRFNSPRQSTRVSYVRPTDLDWWEREL